MEPEEEICLLCDAAIKSDDEVRVVSGELLKKYIKASVKRNDGKRAIIKNQKSFRAHAKCCKHYTEEKKIERQVRQNAVESTSERLLRSDSCHKFDFQNLCFFCSKDASDDFVELQKKKF